MSTPYSHEPGVDMGALQHIADLLAWEILLTKQPGDRLTTGEAILHATDSMVMGDIDFGEVTDTMRVVVTYNATYGGISMGVFCGLTNLALREMNQLAARHGPGVVAWWSKTKRRNTHLKKLSGQRLIGTGSEFGVAIPYGTPETLVANKLNARFQGFEATRTRWLNQLQKQRPRTSRG